MLPSSPKVQEQYVFINPLSASKFPYFYFLDTFYPECKSHRAEFQQALYDYFISRYKEFWKTLYEGQYKNKLNWTMGSPPHFFSAETFRAKTAI